MAAKKSKSSKHPGKDESDLMEMGKFYFINNKYSEAISEFNKVVDINPGCAEAYYNIGLIYEARHELDLAKHMYEKALAIDPDYDIVKEHLNKIVGL